MDNDTIVQPSFELDLRVSIKYFKIGLRSTAVRIPLKHNALASPFLPPSQSHLNPTSVLPYIPGTDLVGLVDSGGRHTRLGENVLSRIVHDFVGKRWRGYIAWGFVHRKLYLRICTLPSAISIHPNSIRFIDPLLSFISSSSMVCWLVEVWVGFGAGSSICSPNIPASSTNHNASEISY